MLRSTRVQWLPSMGPLLPQVSRGPDAIKEYPRHDQGKSKKVAFVSIKQVKN